MVTNTRHQPGKLRNNGSIPGIGKGILSTPRGMLIIFVGMF